MGRTQTPESLAAIRNLVKIGLEAITQTVPNHAELSAFLFSIQQGHVKRKPRIVKRGGDLGGRGGDLSGRGVDRRVCYTCNR
jgi:hypothetical protein